MLTDIGQKIKDLRSAQKLTLQELASRSGLSTGFLSQLERGLSTVAVDSLAKIATALGSDIGAFVAATRPASAAVVTRTHERPLMRVENNGFVHYLLSRNLKGKSFVPRLLDILPRGQEADEEIVTYPHEGEELVYVLEGVLTLILGSERHELYPGDSAHYTSTQAHNLSNNTGRTVKIILINTPNFLDGTRTKPRAQKAKTNRGGQSDG